MKKLVLASFLALMVGCGSSDDYISFKVVGKVLSRGANAECCGIYDPDCDDGKTSTEDTCGFFSDCPSSCGGMCCHHVVPTCCGAACDDGDACTEDSCVQWGTPACAAVCGGSCCRHSTRDCSDGIDCTIDSCDSTTGCSNVPEDEICDDGEPCTVDTCDPLRGCVWEWVFSESCCSLASVAPTLIAPASGENVDTCGAELSWSMEGGSTGYLFEVVLNGETLASGLTNTTFVLPSDVPGPDGTVTWSVHAHGCMGSSTESAAQQFRIRTADKDAPVVVSPANMDVIACGDTLSWRHAGCSGCVYDLYVARSAPPFLQLAADLVATTFELPIDADDPNFLQEGTYLWYVDIRDCSQAVSSTLSSFVVDHAPAAPEVTGIVPFVDAWTSPTPTFTWVQDPIPPDGEFQVYIDGEFAASVGSSTTWTVPADRPLAHGSHVLAVRSIGCMGRTTDSQAFQFQVDAVKPQPFDLERPSDHAWFRDDPIPFAWDATGDEHSGMEEYRFTFGDREFQGTATSKDLYIVSYDRSYNWTGGDDLSGWNGGGSNWRFIQSSVLGRRLGIQLDGYYSSSNSNVVTLSNPIKFTDTTYFGIGYDLCTTENQGWLLVEGRIDGEDSWTTIFGATGDASASHTVDNSESWKLRAIGSLVWFRLRFIPTSGKYCTIGGQYFTSGVWVRFFSIHDDVTPVPDGDYQWYMTAVDRVGNERESSERRMVGIDRVAPSSPATPASAISGSSTPLVTWSPATDALSGIGAYLVLLDGAAVAEVSGTAASVTMPFLDEGSYSWQVRAYDKAGNSLDSDEASLCVDLTAPGKPTNPSPEGTVNALLPNLCFDSPDSETEGCGIDRIEVCIEGASCMVTSEKTGRVCVVPPFLPEGTHTWQAIVYDNAGWSTASDVWSYTTDVTRPAAFDLVAPADGATLFVPRPEFGWQPAADASLVRYELWIDGAIANGTIDPASTTGIAASDLAYGSHWWFVRAVDGVGLSRDSTSTWSVVVWECEPGQHQPCAGEDEGLCDPGYRLCGADGRWGQECIEAVFETPESCNGFDDDCDSATDEELGETTCGTGNCTRTVSNCVQGQRQDCVPYPAEDEICDGLDNDCDGQTDELTQWSDKGQACTVSTGECARSGVKICDADAPSGPTVCSAVPKPGSPEVCDGLDNDCNGWTDEAEEWANKGLPCSIGTGSCLSTGVWICNGNDPGGPIVCSASVIPPELEVCDGLDNDCNGRTDEEGDVPLCDDANCCTDDSCSGSSGCVHATNAVPCDDNDLCTFDDTCSEGNCRGTAAPCASDGPCVAAVTCDGAGGCIRQYRDAGTSCDDGDPCTLDDRCNGTGLCSGNLQVCVIGPCDESAACRAGVCERVRKETGAECDDGDSCTVGDRCTEEGLCEGSRDPSCAAGDVEDASAESVAEDVPDIAGEGADLDAETRPDLRETFEGVSETGGDGEDQDLVSEDRDTCSGQDEISSRDTVAATDAASVSSDGNRGGGCASGSTPLSGTGWLLLLCLACSLLFRRRHRLR